MEQGTMGLPGSRTSAPLFGETGPCDSENAYMQFILGAGPDQEIFKVKRETMLLHSGYLRQLALEGHPLTEAVILDRTKPETFENFVYWIYTGNALSQASRTDLGAICELWVLAKRLAVPGLLNAALTALKLSVQRNGELPLQQLPYIYGHTSAGEGLRGFAVELLSRACNSHLVDEEELHVWPRGALQDVMKYIWCDTAQGKSISRKAEAANVNLCEWWVHDGNLPCGPDCMRQSEVVEAAVEVKRERDDPTEATPVFIKREPVEDTDDVGSSHLPDRMRQSEDVGAAVKMEYEHDYMVWAPPATERQHNTHPRYAEARYMPPRRRRRPVEPRIRVYQDLDYDRSWFPTPPLGQSGQG